MQVCKGLSALPNQWHSHCRNDFSEAAYPSLLHFSRHLFSISCLLRLVSWWSYSFVLNRQTDGEHDIYKSGIHNYWILQTPLQNHFSNYNSRLFYFSISFAWQYKEWFTSFLWFYLLMFLLLPLFVKLFTILLCRVENILLFPANACVFCNTVCYSTDLFFQAVIFKTDEAFSLRQEAFKKYTELYR